MQASPALQCPVAPSPHPGWPSFHLTKVSQVPLMLFIFMAMIFLRVIISKNAQVLKQVQLGLDPPGLSVCWVMASSFVFQCQIQSKNSFTMVSQFLWQLWAACPGIFKQSLSRLLQNRACPGSCRNISPVMFSNRACPGCCRNISPGGGLSFLGEYGIILGGSSGSSRTSYHACSGKSNDAKGAKAGWPSSTLGVSRM